MHVSSEETVELATYQLKGVPILLYKAWKNSRGVGAPLASWEEFKIEFINHYIPFEIQGTHAN